MKKLLILSFNLTREGENETPLSIASILAALKNDKGYGKDFDVIHKPLNLLQNNHLHYLNFENYLESYFYNQFDFIAISSFVWNEYLINPLINHLKLNGFTRKVILGGSQITYANRDALTTEYPQADIFISNYAEKSLLEAITDENPKLYYNSVPDFKTLPSPFLTGEHKIAQNQHMLRWETKRGCPYACSFCAHRNLENGRVNYMELEKGFNELALFKEKRVKRINVLDPVFNMGSSYIQLMNEIERLQFHETTFTFQSKIELLAKSDGNEFLNLIEKTNSHLEFGLQTIIPEEYKIIERKNDIKTINTQLDILKSRGISYETSLIYGLPNQTVDSFKESIDYIKSKGNAKVTAWPLMLLKGTPLFQEKEKWNLKEEVLNDFDIPVVTSSNSFNKDDWFKMKEMADSLNLNQRF